MSRFSKRARSAMCVRRMVSVPAIDSLVCRAAGRFRLMWSTTAELNACCCSNIGATTRRTAAAKVRRSPLFGSGAVICQSVLSGVT